jgi:hypothetical protein
MPYKTIQVKIVLNEDQQRIFNEAKKVVEQDLGGTIAEEQFIQMMLLEAARRVFAGAEPK